jgi:hypothetical protein
MAPKTLIAKFAGTCTRCRRRFPAGATIDWTRAGGAMHGNPAECAAAAASPPPVPTPAIVVNLRPIADFLMAAQQRGLKVPKARFLAPNQRELRLSVASARSKAPGSINVVVAEAWVGRVEPDGRVVGDMARDQALLDTLLTIAGNPAEAAKAYGALMCKCSFCGLPLTDDGSVEVGYGPTCAKKWGLSHQPRGTRVVQAVA